MRCMTVWKHNSQDFVIEPAFYTISSHLTREILAAQLCFVWHAAAFGASPLCISVRRCIQMSICSARACTITQPVAYHSQHVSITFAAAYGAAGTSWCCIQPTRCLLGMERSEGQEGILANTKHPSVHVSSREKTSCCSSQQDTA